MAEQKPHDEPIEKITVTKENKDEVLPKAVRIHTDDPRKASMFRGSMGNVYIRDCAACGEPFRENVGTIRHYCVGRVCRRKARTGGKKARAKERKLRRSRYLAKLPYVQEMQQAEKISITRRGKLFIDETIRINEAGPPLKLAT